MWLEFRPRAATRSVASKLVKLNDEYETRDKHKGDCCR